MKKSTFITIIILSIGLLVYSYSGCTPVIAEYRDECSIMKSDTDTCFNVYLKMRNMYINMLICDTSKAKLITKLNYTFGSEWSFTHP
jgi:hypothetical protein